MRKRKFIEAYCYLYGETKKNAAAAYKVASEGYINAIIESYFQDCRTAFYND